MKLDERTLGLLALIETEGHLARITQQLDRADYVRVQKVLKAVEAPWVRGLQAHAFSAGTDARAVIDKVIVTGSVDTARDVGWFATPPKLAAALAALCEIGHESIVLEPSAGEGALVEAARRRGAKKVYAVERDRVRRARLYGRGDDVSVLEWDDFLDAAPRALGVNRVLMNPPFCKVGKGDHLDHVLHAFACLVPGGRLAAILPAGVEFRQDRRHAGFRSWVAERGGEITRLPSGSFKASGTSVEAVTLVVDKE